jgi:hypothetical protein
MGKKKVPGKVDRPRQKIGEPARLSRPGQLDIRGPLASVLGGVLGAAGSILRPPSPSAR